MSAPNTNASASTSASASAAITAASTGPAWLVGIANRTIPCEHRLLGPRDQTWLLTLSKGPGWIPGWAPSDLQDPLGTISRAAYLVQRRQSHEESLSPGSNNDQEEQQALNDCLKSIVESFNLAINTLNRSPGMPHIRMFEAKELESSDIDWINGEINGEWWCRSAPWRHVRNNVTIAVIHPAGSQPEAYSDSRHVPWVAQLEPSMRQNGTSAEFIALERAARLAACPRDLESFRSDIPDLSSHIDGHTQLEIWIAARGTRRLNVTSTQHRLHAERRMRDANVSGSAGA